MTGSVATGPLTSAEIVSVRRYCGYGPPGGPGIYDPIAVALFGLTQDYIDVIRTVFLDNLALLEADIPAARAKLGIDTAAVFKRNAAELAERESLFRSWCLRLCATLGIESGPSFAVGIPLPAVFVV